MKLEASTSHHPVQHAVETARRSASHAPAPKLICAAQWCHHHSWPPIGGLRHLIFHAKSNGFDGVIRRVGRRVLIDEAAFFQWIDAQKGNAK